MLEPNENQRNSISETTADVGEIASEIGVDVAIETVFAGAASVADGALGIAGELIGGVFDGI